MANLTLILIHTRREPVIGELSFGLSRYKVTDSLLENSLLVRTEQLVNAVVVSDGKIEKHDTVLVKDLSNFLIGNVVGIYGTVAEIDLGWSTTQTKSLADCKKIVIPSEQISKETKQLIANGVLKDNDKVSVDYIECLVNPFTDESACTGCPADHYTLELSK